VIGSEPRRGYWGKLTADDCVVLANVGSRLAFSAGRPVLAQEDDTGDVVIVLSGFTKVVARVAAGRHVVLALRGPGDLLGEMAHVNGGRRSASVAAISEVEVIRVPRADFSRFLDGSTHASRLLRKMLVDRLREADSDRIAAASLTVGQRLARLLLTLARRHGVPSPDGGLTVALLSQDDLAACVGGGRRTVARQMRQWRERDIVSTTRRSVTVRQPEALARMVGHAASAF
jgi:CRP/FNR family transcriptional regulator, cyclic AMP receptor protein